MRAHRTLAPVAVLLGTSLLAGLGLLTSPVALANNKNLIENGVYAAAYGDVAIDKGDWDGESVAALRLKGGFQLLRYDFLSLAVGYQKTGFYSTQRNMSRSEGETSLDFRGPLLELHLLPEGYVTGSLAFSSNEGYLFREEESVEKYGFSGCGSRSCTLIVQRNTLKAQELLLQANVKVANHLFVTLGMGSRKISGKTFYEIKYNDTPKSLYQADPDRNWSANETFFLIGLRGSQL